MHTRTCSTDIYAWVYKYVHEYMRCKRRGLCVQVCWAIPHPPPGWLTADVVDSIVYVASWPRCQTLQDWRQSWFVPRTFGQFDIIQSVASQHVWKLWFVIGILTRIGCELVEEFNATREIHGREKASRHIMSLYVVISRNWIDFPFQLLDTGQLGGQDMCCRLQGVGMLETFFWPTNQSTNLPAAAPAAFVDFSVAVVVLVVAGVMVMIIFAAAQLFFEYLLLYCYCYAIATVFVCCSCCSRWWCPFILDLVSLGFCEVRATFKSEADAMKFAALLQEPVEAEVPWWRVPSVLQWMKIFCSSPMIHNHS